MLSNQHASSSQCAYLSFYFLMLISSGNPTVEQHSSVRPTNDGGRRRRTRRPGHRTSAANAAARPAEPGIQIRRRQEAAVRSRGHFSSRQGHGAHDERRSQPGDRRRHLHTARTAAPRSSSSRRGPSPSPGERACVRTGASQVNMRVCVHGLVHGTVLLKFTGFLAILSEILLSPITFVDGLVTNNLRTIDFWFSEILC